MIQYNNEDEYWEATLFWKPPRKWIRGEGVELEESIKEENGIYRFEMRHGNQKKSPKNAYIGMTFDQTFEVRLHNSGRIKKIDEWYPKGQLWVSVAKPDLHGNNHVKTRYKDLESNLIYFTKPEQNYLNTKWSPDTYFKIKNLGYRGPIPRRIDYPVAKIVR